MQVGFKILQNWIKDEHGIAATEFLLVFPILFLIMLGVWDAGHLMLASQKVVSSSQVVADLIGRELTVDEDELNQAIQAGRLVLGPFNTESYKVEILSVGFDADGDIETDSSKNWEINSEGGSVGEDLYDKVQELGIPFDGIIAVRVKYTYEPFFIKTFTSDIDMEEVSYSRGRRTSVVVAGWED